MNKIFLEWRKMMSSIDLNDFIPDMKEIIHTNLDSVYERSHLVLAGGFEDRVLGFLEMISSSKDDLRHKFTGISVINYLPFDSKNESKREKVMSILKKMRFKSQDIHEYYFDRENPAEFIETSKNLLQSVNGVEYVYLDISGMSKILILYLLHILWKENNPFSIIYTRAAEHGPTKEEYKKLLEKGDFGQDILMELLFSGVYEPMIPSEFKGSGSLGGSRALIGFLGYNKRQTIGAAAIVPYQLFIPVVGIPSKPKWKWKMDALLKINNSGLLTSGQLISNIPEIEISDKSKKIASIGEYRINVSMFDYKETIRTLIWIREVHRYSHFLTIAPFGSKMQTLGIFIFTKLYPETQIVYASPKDFHPRYSKGIENVYEIQFNNCAELEKQILYQVEPNLAYLDQLASK